jgi:non-ribosomal peptide synthetase component F
VKRHGCDGPQNSFTLFNAGDVEGSIAARFEAQVVKTPDAFAITDAVNRWSYSEVNGFANRIGSELLSDRQPSEVPIALLFEHDAWVEDRPVASQAGLTGSGTRH